MMIFKKIWIALLMFVFSSMLLAILLTGCNKESNPVYFIFINKVEVQSESQESPPKKLPLPDMPVTANPHPDWIQETFNPGDKMFPGIITTQLKKSVTFSRYTLFSRETGRETEKGLSGDLGPFASMSWNLIAQDNPWPVPDEPGIYEVRVYLGNEVVASAVFEVRLP